MYKFIITLIRNIPYRVRRPYSTTNHYYLLLARAPSPSLLLSLLSHSGAAGGRERAGAGGDRHGCQERQCCNGDFGKAACSRAGGPDSRQRGRRTKKRSYITRPFLRVLRGPSKSSYFRGEFLKHRGWHRHAVRMAMMSVKFRREGVDSRRNWANS